jgi:hypothetical protein
MTRSDRQLDELGRLRRRTTFVATTGLVASVSMGVWAFWPLPPSPPPDRHAEQRSPIPTQAFIPTPTIPVAAFRAPLWQEPPTIAPIGPPLPPAPALNLQLLAIGQESGGVPTAMIYDADLDRVTVLRPLGHYRGFRVVRLDRAGAELRSGEQRIIMTMTFGSPSERGGGTRP